MSFNKSSNTLLFTNDFKAPGRYSTELKIQIEDGVGKKSKEIPFKIIITKVGHAEFLLNQKSSNNNSSD